MSLGKKIKALRREKRITQEKLAKHLNISYQAISKWENEDSQSDISLLVPIANFFSVSLDDLLGNEAYSSRSGYTSHREKLLQLYEFEKTDENFMKVESAYH